MIVRAARFPGLYDKLIVDLFAGSGGAGTGIEEAFCAAGIDRGIDLAINHDLDALACYGLNHPLTECRREDVWDIDPEAAVAGRQVGLLWASPDCTDFSKAKGGRPLRDVQRRSLAHVINRWAFAVRPDVIKLENVEEFEQWGLLDADGRPLRDGRCFSAFVDSLRHLGYRVDWRHLRACEATPGQATSNQANTGAGPVLITNPAIAVMFERDDELRRTIAEQLDLLAMQGHPMRQPYACAACGMPADHHHLPCQACGCDYFVQRFLQEHQS